MDATGNDYTSISDMDWLDGANNHQVLNPLIISGSDLVLSALQ
jgi:hypothetical protein